MSSFNKPHWLAPPLTQAQRSWPVCTRFPCPEQHPARARRPDGQYGDKVDLWLNNAPAHGLNGSYSSHLFADYAVDVLSGYVQRAAANRTKGLFLLLAWPNTHAPLQVPTWYCANRSGGPESRGHGTPSELGVSSDCPTEGPKTKGHSLCYCYNDAGPKAAALSTPHGESVAGWTGLGLSVHGNRTAAGDNSDRHTFNAMARVLDEGIKNVTAKVDALGLSGTTLTIFIADNGGASLEAPLIPARPLKGPVERRGCAWTRANPSRSLSPWRGRRRSSHTSDVPPPAPSRPPSNVHCRAGP